MNRWLATAVMLGLAIAWAWLVRPARSGASSGPVYIDGVRIEFTDGTSWSSTKPAWCVWSHTTDGRGETRWCKGAAPATTQP